MPEDIRKYNYTLQIFEKGMKVLLLADGDSRRRLKAAFNSDLHVLSKRHFPPHLRKEWWKIEERITREVDVIDYDYINGERYPKGLIELNCKRMYNKTAIKLIREIYYLHCKLENFMGVKEYA